MQVCPSCGESNPSRFRECVFCGEGLAAPAQTSDERKILTILFCDLKGSTALGESLDPESLSEVLELYFTAMTRVLERHGGSIQKFIGDAIVAAFGIPVLHEDDALRAVRAAVEMRDSLARVNERLQAGYGVTLQLRIGVHTGEVLVHTSAEGQPVLTGDTMNTAARLEQYAGDDEILIGDPTFRLVRDAVEAQSLRPLELKGKAEPVEAHRLLRAFGDEQASRRHAAPIVGREAELGALLKAFARARGERRCVLATVVGEAGVGKSRLVSAALEAIGIEATVLRSRCLPYGEGITFLPLLGVVREAAGIGPDDGAALASSKLEALTANPEVARRVASAVGWSREALPVAEVFWATRELLQGVARQRPLVVVIDDVHWAQPVLLELIDHVVEQVAGAAILLLCTARPDLLEQQPEWSEGARASRLLLERLADDATDQVITNVMGGVELPEQIRRTIIRSSEGNPLFVEQLISMLIDRRLLFEVRGGWRVSGSLEQIDVPPGIQALLTARLDMLQPQERAVLEPASVIGLEFPSSAVRELVPAAASDGVALQLASMERKQLVRPAPAAKAELGDFRFHHVLIRDAAYQRALKRTRAELHERFADWLEQRDRRRGRTGENDEIVGYHLEQAFAYGGQLGAIDAHVRVLGSRAAEKLCAAGQRAFVRGDLPAAINLLGRAVATLPEVDPVRLGIIPDLAEAVLETGDFERALEILGEAERPAAAAANEPAVARAALVHLLVDFYAGREETWTGHVQQETQRTIAIFEAAGDQAGLATAWRLRYGLEGSALRFDEAVQAAEKVIDHAQAAGDIRQQRRGAVGYALSALHGPTPVGEAIERCEELILAIEGDRRSHALVQLCLAHLLAMAGQVDRARLESGTARDMLEELGHSVFSASTSTETARIELLAGDLNAAEQLLRRDNAALDALGETFLRSTVTGLLARVLVLRGDADEAERFAADAQRLAAPDDVEAQVLWRAALGRRRALQGRLDDALALADEAVAFTQDTSAPLLRAQALTDRAAVLLAAERAEEAEADLAGALELYLAKGNRLGAEGLKAFSRSSAVA